MVIGRERPSTAPSHRLTTICHNARPIVCPRVCALHASARALTPPVSLGGRGPPVPAGEGRGSYRRGDALPSKGPRRAWHDANNDQPVVAGSAKQRPSGTALHFASFKAYDVQKASCDPLAASKELVAGGANNKPPRPPAVKTQSDSNKASPRPNAGERAAAMKAALGGAVNPPRSPPAGRVGNRAARQNARRGLANAFNTTNTTTTNSTRTITSDSSPGPGPPPISKEKIAGSDAGWKGCVAAADKAGSRTDCYAYDSRYRAASQH